MSNTLWQVESNSDDKIQIQGHKIHSLENSFIHTLKNSRKLSSSGRIKHEKLPNIFSNVKIK